MSRHFQRIGQWGESVAADYLEKLGYIVISRNERTPYGEIDIVAEKEGLTIFVEVKTRTTKTFGPPEMAVTRRKQEHMMATAEYYAQKNEIDHWQIDVVAVERNNDSVPDILHFKNALG